MLHTQSALLNAGSSGKCGNGRGEGNEDTRYPSHFKRMGLGKDRIGLDGTGRRAGEILELHFSRSQGISEAAFRGVLFISCSLYSKTSCSLDDGGKPVRLLWSISL